MGLSKRLRRRPWCVRDFIVRVACAVKCGNAA